MFLVAGSGGATAVTRGLNGNIPPRVDSLTQVPATLVEWHDKPQRTEFNIFASQGDAESWLGENWRALLAAGVDQVSLLDDIRTEYGPMSLHPED